MLTTRIPLSICDHIDKIYRGFTWNGSGDRHKVHLLRWDSICKPKSEGGLGFQKARVMKNNANLMKLAWKLIHNRDAPWVQVMRSKYKYGEHLILDVHKKGRILNGWKGITQVWPKFSRNRI